MTSKELEKLEIFLTESFTNGLFVRELRLSKEELDYVKIKYPKALIKQEDDSTLDGKQWYQIDLLPDNAQTNNRLTEDEIVAIQQENKRLKEELQSIKESNIVLNK